MIRSAGARRWLPLMVALLLCYGRQTGATVSACERSTLKTTQNV
ncbi:hypothetical protein [Sodalis glossinidius]|nr:hypothetical protein [Sodalis glossinidius]